MPYGKGTPDGGGYMRKALLTFIIAATLSPCFAKYSGGTGDPNNPYQIATPEDLNDIHNYTEDLNKCFLVTDDINLAQYANFNVISGFKGVFDGNNHTISNLNYFANGMGAYAGLFPWCPEFSLIKNVRLVDPNISAPRGQAGALFGFHVAGIIINCHVEGGIVGGNFYVGGLVGRSQGLIYRCSAATNVLGDRQVGGLVGTDRYGNGISQSYSTSTVNAISGAGGGLVGTLIGTTISDSYSMGSVTSSKGPCGGLFSGGDGSIIVHCYSATIVSGSGDFLGGLVGIDNNANSYTGCFWDSNLNPSLPGVGDGNRPGVFGETTENLHMRSTFINAGWDFVWETANGPNDVWAICEGVSYPKLAWQFTAGDSDNDKDVDFTDFAPLANKWMQADSNLYCGGTDLTGDGLVDMLDIAVFADDWLVGL
jgi:hypothetical protein